MRISDWSSDVCSSDLDMARAAGFANINLDLMFALPQQTLTGAAADLRGALALAPEHLSYYQLTLEPNTEFGARPPVLPDDELAWDIQEQRSEEHTSELQSLMRISYAVFCLKKKQKQNCRTIT